MQKKDIGLGILIIVVGAIVYMRNPLFLSPINLGNTANLIGLFGLFAIGQGFVIMTGGIDLSVGSVIALLGVLFVDMVGKFGVPWPLAVAIIIVLGVLIGLAHGILITRFRLQPFVVTLCGLLIYRGIARGYTAESTAGFPFGSSYPQLEWLTIGRSFGIPHSFLAMLIVAAVMWVILHHTVFWPSSLCGWQERRSRTLFGDKHPFRHGDGIRDLCGACIHRGHIFRDVHQVSPTVFAW